VLDAITKPRKINDNKADAALTRAKLDKIVGYRISPIVMTKCSARSAGRVQSAALKVIVQREEEINSFVPETYYEIWLPFVKDGTEYRAQYKGTDSKKIVSINDKASADKVIADCKPGNYVLKTIVPKDRQIQSKLPFTTSTFQQEVSSKLGISPKRAMECAQKLFEGIELGGKHVALITYIRTDSTDLNKEFVDSLANYVKTNYGKEYYSPVKTATKGRNVQDAHEAIRPVDLEMTPSKLSSLISDPQLVKVYKIIYARTVAASMSDCVITDTEYGIYNGQNKFVITSHSVKFDGFKKVYEYKDDDDDDLQKFPNLVVGEKINDKPLELVSKQTSPAKRYSEATLIKKMEDLGIGRPSTFASIVSVLLDETRGYATLEGRLMKPTEKGIRLSHFLDKAFPDIINLTYTAQMEDDLDKVSDGKLDSVKFLTEFYKKLSAEITLAKQIDSDRAKPVLVGRKCPKCGKDLVYRVGRFGRFIACSGYNGTKHGCKYTERIPDPNQQSTNNTQPTQPKAASQMTKYKCPKCGKPMVKRTNGKTGEAFYACSGFPKCHNTMNQEQFMKLVEQQGTSNISKDAD
jgi:DNA topoisomerase I